MASADLLNQTLCSHVNFEEFAAVAKVNKTSAANLRIVSDLSARCATTVSVV